MSYIYIYDISSLRVNILMFGKLRYLAVPFTPDTKIQQFDL